MSQLNGSITASAVRRISSSPAAEDTAAGLRRRAPRWSAACQYSLPAVSGLNGILFGTRKKPANHRFDLASREGGQIDRRYGSECCRTGCPRSDFGDERLLEICLPSPGTGDDVAWPAGEVRIVLTGPQIPLDFSLGHWLAVPATESTLAPAARKSEDGPHDIIPGGHPPDQEDR